MESREQIKCRQFAMIASWQQSGFSQKQYCLQNGIAYHIFHYWYKRYRHNQTANSAGAGSFIPLRVPAASSASCVEVALCDGKKILFHQPVSVDYLKALIA